MQGSFGLFPGGGPYLGNLDRRDVSTHSMLYCARTYQMARLSEAQRSRPARVLLTFPLLP